MSLGQWPPGLAGEGVDAWELGQSGRAVVGGFPMSAEGWDGGGGVLVESASSRAGVRGCGGVTGAT